MTFLNKTKQQTSKLTQNTTAGQAFRKASMISDAAAANTHSLVWVQCQCTATRLSQCATFPARPQLRHLRWCSQ